MHLYSQTLIIYLSSQNSTIEYPSIYERFIRNYQNANGDRINTVTGINPLKVKMFMIRFVLPMKQ